MGEVIVYGLRFEAGEIYIGMTKDLPRRLTEHRRGQSPSVKPLTGTFQLIYSKTFVTYADARTHEKFLKSGAGRAFLLSIRT